MSVVKSAKDVLHLAVQESLSKEEPKTLEIALVKACLYIPLYFEPTDTFKPMDISFAFLPINELFKETPYVESTISNIVQLISSFLMVEGGTYAFYRAARVLDRLKLSQDLILSLIDAGCSNHQESWRLLEALEAADDERLIYEEEF